MLQIIFEFVGGPNDGRVFHGTLGQPCDAERFYLITNHGAVGQRFKVASQYAVETLAEEKLQEEKRHFYVVTDRVQEGDQVRVRCQYVPQPP